MKYVWLESDDVCAQIDKSDSCVYAEPLRPRRT